MDEVWSGERVEIRRAEGSDVAALQEVFEAAGDFFLSVTGRAAPDADAAAREVGAAAATPGREVGLVHELGAPGAVGALGWWASHPAEADALLGMLMVVPAARGRGVAREALRLLEAALRDRGIRRLRTAVGAGDLRAQRVVEALGFSSLDERTHVSLDRGRMMIAFYGKEL